MPLQVARGVFWARLTFSSHSEISSCNYVAREQGVTKGMWMARAKELCPELIILPYEVEKIREVGREIE